MAKLKKEFLMADNIEVRFGERYYPVSKERLCEMRDLGQLDDRFDSMFEIEVPSMRLAAQEFVEVQTKENKKK